MFVLLVPLAGLAALGQPGAAAVDKKPVDKNPVEENPVERDPLGKPPAVDPAAWEILDRHPAKGEQCIVCRQRVHQGEIVQVRHKGRVFFVAAKMLPEFEADPQAYFAALQARGALFDETAMETPPMQIGWLVFGLYVLTGLVFGAACSYVALDRGLASWRWFFAGLALNVLALAAVLTRRPTRQAPHPTTRGMRKIPATSSPVACGSCGAANHPAAAACGACGHRLTPTVEAETARA